MEESNFNELTNTHQVYIRLAGNVEKAKQFLVDKMD